MSRRLWTSQTDEQLLAQCEVDTYRASGPGGQKRNKTSSAVRIRHGPSGLLVIAEESRSQHENRARALRRLRRAFFLQIREDLVIDEEKGIQGHPDLEAARQSTGRVEVGVRDARFWPAAALVLDVLTYCQGRLAEAGQLLGITTGNLGDFLGSDPKLWERANQIRHHFGLKTLR